MVLTSFEKADILIEALPYIKRFNGKTVVIKYGGHAMIDVDLKKAVMQDIVMMKLVGINPVVVHGGGPDINRTLECFNIKSKFVNGLRVTDKETMEIVEMVLGGKVNKAIVAGLNSTGGKAVGLCGKDGNMIEATKKIITKTDETGKTVAIDIGYVGEITSINTEIISTVIEKGYIPVISPIGVDKNGQSYNINADYVASAVAIALNADKIVLLTDVEGIFKDYKDKNSLISSLSTTDVPNLINKGIISGGMIPKVQCCVEAIENCVSKAHIIDGRLKHSILLEIFTDEGIGTMVIK